MAVRVVVTAGIGGGVRGLAASRVAAGSPSTPARTDLLVALLQDRGPDMAGVSAAVGVRVRVVVVGVVVVVEVRWWWWR